jgi:hypothetical protein
MNHKYRIAFIWCAAVALAPSTLAAGLSASVDTFFENNGVIDCIQNSGGGFGVINAPLVGCLQTFGQSEFQSAGSASAAFGTLRAFGSVSYTNLNVPAGSTGLNWFDRADADMSDTLTIPRGSFLDLTVAISGTVSNATVFFFLDGAVPPFSFPGLNTFRIPFRAGVPFNLDEGLRVDIEGSLSPDQPQGRSFAQFADFSHTVQIVGTQVFDSAGNPVADAPITSASGFDYNNPLGGFTAAPEPVSILLVAAGMSLVWALRVMGRRSRQNPS